MTTTIMLENKSTIPQFSLFIDIDTLKNLKIKFKYILKLFIGTKLKLESITLVL